MTPGTIGIVLIAAVAHALWNIASKYKRGDTYVFAWAYTTLSMLLFLPVAVVFVALGGARPTWTLVLAALVSGILHAGYSLALQFGYDSSDLTVVYPVARGVGPLLTLVVAVVALGERPGAGAIAGALVIVVGVSIVAGNPIRGRSGLAALLWGVATGVTIAGYTLWDSYAVTSLHLAPITYFAANLVFETIALTPGAVRRYRGIRAELVANARLIPVIAVLSPLAYVLVLTALQTAPVALVAPLRESSIVIGALLAWWLFHEGHLGRRIAGAATVLGGIALISLL